MESKEFISILFSYNVSSDTNVAVFKFIKNNVEKIFVFDCDKDEKAVPFCGYKIKTNLREFIDALNDFKNEIEMQEKDSITAE